MTESELIAKLMQSKNNFGVNHQVNQNSQIFANVAINWPGQAIDAQLIADTVFAQCIQYFVDDENGVGVKTQDNKHHQVKEQLLMCLGAQDKDNAAIVFSHLMDNLLASEHTDFIDCICHDEKLSVYLKQSYQGGLKNWLLKALKASQYTMFEYLLTSQVLNLDLKSTRVLTISMNKMIPYSELANMVLNKTPRILFYLIDYVTEHQINVMPEINKLLQKYHPEGLLWLDKKDLYLKLDDEILSKNSNLDQDNSEMELLNISKI
jgi:hypothetical protein